MLRSIGKFDRPAGPGSVFGNPSASAVRPAPTTTTYQPPRGQPPSQAYRQNAPVYNRPPLEEETVVEEISLPAPSRAPASTASYSSGSKSSNYVYPEFKVLQLEPSGDGSANFLPISELNCQISEIYVGLRKDGRAIEFRRSVTQNGDPRVEVQSFNLPYQVSDSTCSAQYFPHEKGGLLRIKLGKILSGGTPRGEQQLLQFQIPANQNSNSDKVMIEVDQQPDHYRFYPGSGSRYATDFTAVLSGKTLEFRSTYSVEENDGSIRTINGKQTVQLPIAPTTDQIDVGYDSVTIWPGRQSGAPIYVPDRDVRISLG